MRVVRITLLVVLLTAIVPLIPFLILGDPFENQLAEWVRGNATSSSLCLLVGFVLAIDIFLPVPSSGVCTYAGAELGLVWATIASWVGLTLGSIVGYYTGRLAGRPILLRSSHPDDIARLEEMTARFGMLALILTRPMPLLAETAVLLAGTLRQPLVRFLIPVGLTNFALAITYAAFGAWAQDQQTLPYAIAASLVLPILLTFAYRWLHPISHEPPGSRPGSPESSAIRVAEPQELA